MKAKSAQEVKEVNGMIKPTLHAYESAKAYLASIPEAPEPEFTLDGDGGCPAGEGKMLCGYMRELR